MRNRPSQTAVSTESTHPLFRVRTFSSLRHRNYRFLWGSTLFNSAGNWIQQVTLGWLIYDMTSNALMVGALHGARSVPFLLAGPVGGVLSDRMDRRKLLIVNQALLGVVAVAFSILVISGRAEVWHLFVFTVVSGSGWAMNNPLRQALVANTVPRKELMNAIALNSVAFNINRILGPALGGILIAFFGPGTNFLIQAVCYVGVAFMVFQIHIQSPDVPSETKPARPSPLADLWEGLTYVYGERKIFALILMAMIPSLFVMPFASGLMPVVAKEVFDVGADGLGLLLSVFGIGALLGTFTLASLGDVRHKGLLILAAGVSTGLLMMAFSQTSSIAVALPFMAAVGTAHMVYNTTNNTILQTITPDALRGRVMSIYMLDHGLVPLGSLIAGLLAHFYGSPLAILVGGTLTALLTLITGLKFRRTLLED